MTNLSLNPIFEGLEPIFKQLKTAAISACLVVPAALNIQVKSVETVQIVSVQKLGLSPQEKQAFYEFASNAINLVQVTSALTDFAISLAPQAFNVISTNDIQSLEEKMNEYDHLITNIISEMNQFDLNHPTLVSELNNLSNKMHMFCNIVKSEKYKKESDEVVLSRIYRTPEDAGYTYKSSDSFDDFKKAVMM